ncbi:hypothetical protein INR49_020655 [Caranx melampygus]|nr:hypothetical protein INR49_020655 [Caranx melampygus]
MAPADDVMTATVADTPVINGREMRLDFLSDQLISCDGRTTDQDRQNLGPRGSPSCSSLTTKELQQHLKAVKQRERPVRLMFEIPSSRVYEVVVMRSGSFDSHRVSIERRYTAAGGVWGGARGGAPPPQTADRELQPDVISERRLALQDYLARLYSVRCVRHSPLFPAFFTEQEQGRGHGLLRAGQFRPALQQLQVVLEIQEKLLPWQSPTLVVPALCALAVCHRDLEQPEQAFATAQRALPPVRRYGLKRYRAALLELLVDLGYELGRPVAQIQDELRVLRDAERGEVTSRSLKELVVQEFGQTGATGANRGRQGPTGADRGKQGQTGANRGKQGQTGPNRGKQGQTGADRGRQGPTGADRAQQGNRATGADRANRGKQGQTGADRAQQGQTGANRGRQGQQGQTGANRGRQGQTGANRGPIQGSTSNKTLTTK